VRTSDEVAAGAVAILFAVAFWIMVVCAAAHLIARLRLW
jgi:hypothetical protein